VVEQWQNIDTTGIHPLNRDEVDRIKTKLRTHGPKSLTPDERAFMERFATR
jgi:hypothetical protein